MINKIIKLLGGYTFQEYLNLRYEKNKREAEIIQLQSDYLNLEKKLTDFTMKNFRNMTLQSFKDYLNDNVAVTEIQYGGGRDKPQALHKFLALTPEMEAKYFAWVFDLSLMDGQKFSEFKNADEIIHYLNIIINQKIQPSRKYRTDKQAWGKQEYWETAEELYEVIVNTNLGLDCESIAFFKYHCFKSMLTEMNLWNENKWRLRCFRVNILGYGNHVCLGWVKEGVNDWLPVESTFYPDEFEKIWNNDMTLRNNYFYQIECSFDDGREYTKII
jgi:predicted transglutaminase-like cysteine proteinase